MIGLDAEPLADLPAGIALNQKSNGAFCGAPIFRVQPFPSLARSDLELQVDLSHQPALDPLLQLVIDAAV